MLCLLCRNCSLSSILLIISSSLLMILTLQRQFPSVDDRFHYSEVTVPDELTVNQVKSRLYHSAVVIRLCMRRMWYLCSLSN